MYELKTLLPEFDIQLPTSMYTMKNQSLSSESHANKMQLTNGVCDGHATVKLSTDIILPTTTAKKHKTACALDLDVLNQQIQRILKSSNEVGAVLVRQDVILTQLKELKAQLADIRSTLGVCQKGLQHTTTTNSKMYVQNTGNNGGIREEPLHDIVINGHPNFIPFGILALKNAWHDLFDINVKAFTHSTMVNIGQEAQEFEKKLQQTVTTSTTTTTKNKPKINVTLIWKNCEHTEMISSPTMYVPIYGEVNILRYFGRIGPAPYRYENSLLCNEIDLVLDICYQLLRCNTPKAVAVMVRALNQRLGKQQYFGGDAISIADIGVHSSLKRMPSIKDKDLTPTLIAWRKRAELVTRI